MAANLVAVVGVGQTVHRTARKDLSLAGLVREAAQEALEDVAAQRVVKALIVPE